jgi:phosphoribosyl-ATP pyrophosphohydrolase/phosphoribosyl-AMP cyclohydrolase
VAQARHLVSLGAEKVILGTAAFGGGTAGLLNEPFLRELTGAIGKQRVIIAVDALGDRIVTRGWQSLTNLSLHTGAQAAEQWCNELLFTAVEREGRMEGAETKLAESLREAVSCRLTIAGGVSSAQEVAFLAWLGCDVQLGMALYTGKVKLAQAFIAGLSRERSGGLIPVIAQSTAGEVLMLGFANQEALAKTFETGLLTFWSRSRKQLWTKGETSGNTLKLVRIRADCDRDTILATVEPAGPVCHTGGWNCFTSEAGEKSSLERLYRIIGERFAAPTPGSYTATLDPLRVREKVSEEAAELVAACGHDEQVWECADLLYFMSVLMYQGKVTWGEVLRELDRRHKEK